MGDRAPLPELMSKYRAENVADLLGIPHGTAANRLRKALLFKYVCLAGHDTCFNCGQKITSVNELSIEHIKPWEGISADLFWDLDNIAFSHLKCNRPHRRFTPPTKVGPEGTAWCYKCKKFLTVDAFNKHRGRHNGLNSLCREHANKERNKYR